MQGVFQALLWAGRGQNTVCPWQLYEILRKCREYFKLCCGRTNVRIRSAHGGLYGILRKSRAYFKLRCGQSRIRIRSDRDNYIQMSYICKYDFKFFYPGPHLSFGGEKKFIKIVQ